MNVETVGACLKIHFIIQRDIEALEINYMHGKGTTMIKL